MRVDQTGMSDKQGLRVAMKGVAIPQLNKQRSRTSMWDLKGQEPYGTVP